MFWFLVCSAPMPWGGVTLTFCVPDARVRKLGGSSGPEELQEAPWGPGAAPESALLGEPLPACSSPATPGPSRRRRRGGRWRAGRDRRSSPSTPEPVGGGWETTRQVRTRNSFRAFSRDRSRAVTLNASSLRPSPTVATSWSISNTHTHTTNSLISRSPSPTRLRWHTHSLGNPLKRLSLMLAGDLMGFSQG